MGGGGNGGRSPKPTTIVEMNAIARDSNGNMHLVAVLPAAEVLPMLDCARWEGNPAGSAVAKL
jgi:hypothetical protein